MQRRSLGRRGTRAIDNTLALVLAGGSGTRLKTMTRWHAKPAIPFGGPFRTIDFTLSNCVHSGIRRIGVLTQYKSYSLNCHIQRGWNFLNRAPGEFIELLPAQQRLGSDWYQGTADAIYQNLDIIDSHAPEYVLVLAGDHIYTMDYGDMIAQHRETGADLSIGCIEVDLEAARGFGVMSIDDHGRINAFEEKPVHPRAMPDKPDRALASMGIYVFKTEFLKRVLCQDALNGDSSHDFGKDIIPGIINQHHIHAFPFTDDAGNPSYWRDVGTVDSYWQANMELIGRNPALNIYNRQWPILTAQEQYPPATFLFNSDFNRQGSAVNSIVSSGCVVDGASVKDSVLFPCSRIDPGSSISESLLLPGSHVGANCRLNRVIVDQDCDIPDGTVIGVDLPCDATRFSVSPSGVVLVSRQDIEALPLRQRTGQRDRDKNVRIVA